MEHTEYDEYPMDEFWDDPKYIAYMEELQRRDAAGTPFPITDTLPCWECGNDDPANAQRDEHGNTYVDRVCTALGPVTNRADPTQTYELSCGHLTI